MNKLFAFCFAAAASLPCAAQTSTFNGATGLLDSPCVTLYRSGVPVVGAGGAAIHYQAQLRAASAQQFSLASLGASSSIDECLGRFDAATNVYTDTVNLGDTAYQVTMKLGSNNVFTLESYQSAGPAKTMLWVVSNGTNTVYLGGTIHILRDADYPLPRAYGEAYAKSPLMYFELDLDSAAETGSGMTVPQIQAMVRDPEGKLLSQVLSASTYQALSGYLARKGIPIANVDYMSAQMAVNVLLVPDAKQQAGATAIGVDASFANRAMTDGKLISGLESFASQITLIHSLNEGAEEELVREALDDLANSKPASSAANLIDAWRRGDVSYVQNTSEEIRGKSARDYALVLTNRNNNWLPQIEAMLQTAETEMVLVGAAHVAGPEGLVALLKSRGYRVTKY